MNDVRAVPFAPRLEPADSQELIKIAELLVNKDIASARGLARGSAALRASAHTLIDLVEH